MQWGHGGDTAQAAGIAVRARHLQRVPGTGRMRGGSAATRWVCTGALRRHSVPKGNVRRGFEDPLPPAPHLAPRQTQLPAVRAAGACKTCASSLAAPAACAPSWLLPPQAAAPALAAAAPACPASGSAAPAAEGRQELAALRSRWREQWRQRWRRQPAPGLASTVQQRRPEERHQVVG